MYHSYPSSSPYLLPTGPPGPPTNNALPSLAGFDRIPGAHSAVPGVPSTAVTPPVNSPQSPNQQQRLPPVNGIPLNVEPKLEKVTFSNTQFGHGNFSFKKWLFREKLYNNNAHQDL